MSTEIGIREALRKAFEARPDVHLHGTDQAGGRDRLLKEIESPHGINVFHWVATRRRIKGFRTLSTIKHWCESELSGGYVSQGMVILSAHVLGMEYCCRYLPQLRDPVDGVNISRHPAPWRRR